MSVTLLIALVAGLPLAGLTWLAAAAVERLGAGVRLRLAAWTAALIVPIALAPASLLIEALDIHSPLAAANSRSLSFLQTVAGTQRQPDAEAMNSSPILTAAPSVPSYQEQGDEVAASVTPRDPLHSIRWTPAILAVLALVAGLRLAALVLALRRVSHLVAASEPIQGKGYGGLAPVRQSDHDTPVLAGLRRPVVLLPRKLVASLTPAQAALICAHEQAHLAAGDHVAHLIEEAALRLFWFNPVLGLIRARLSAAREEACDARALAASDGATRRAYAESLLAALRLAGEAEPIAAFTGLGHHDAARRLLAILHPRAGVSAPAVAAAGLLAVCLAAATGGLSLALAAQPLRVASFDATPAATTIRVASPTRGEPALPPAAVTTPVATTIPGATPEVAPVGRDEPYAVTIAADLPQAVTMASQPAAQTARPAPAQAVGPLTGITVQDGGLVVLSYGETASIQSTNDQVKATVDSDGQMTVTPCKGCESAVVRVTSPNVPPLAVAGGGAITVDSGFPAQATGSASIRNGGMINLTGVSVQSGETAIKEGGQIMVRASTALTASVKNGGNVLYLGDPAVTSIVKDGGRVTKLGN